MNKKTTVILEEEILAQAREIINRGLFKSMNAFIESAMRDEIEKIKQESIRQAFVEASKDPLFLSDIAEVERDFEFADFDEGVK